MKIREIRTEADLIPITSKGRDRKKGGSEWKARLIKDKNGNIRAILNNAVAVLENHPELAGVIGYDEFALRTMRMKPTPWTEDVGPWTDQDDLETTRWLQQQGVLVRMPEAAQAVQAVAYRRRFHPVRDYLNGRKWDGIRRIDSWLIDYLGVAPSEYAAAVGARWLIAAVARIMRPGCKVDNCLILEGSQGLFKSKVVDALAGDWRTDGVPDLHSKDAAVQLNGVWIVELAELDSLTRAEAGTIKAFLSRHTDRYRPPYGRRAEDFPRQCVFVGTANLTDYLKDETGGRRFWPVACAETFEKDQKIDVEGLAAVRDQLFAEAAVRYREGVKWWLDTPELEEAAREEQADRTPEHPWKPQIEAYLLKNRNPTAEEILEDCLRLDTKDRNQANKTTVGKVMTSLGWRARRGRKDGGGHERRYEKRK